MPITRAVLALALVSTPAFADSITKSTSQSLPAEIELAAGAYHANRSLTVAADSPESVTPYNGVPNDGVQLNAATYPLRHVHANGWVSSGGLSIAFARSVGASVTVDDNETVSSVDVEQTLATAAMHHRLTAGRISVDSQLGVGHSRYSFDNMPRAFEMPSTAQTYASAGLQVGFNAFRGITLTAGAQVLAGLGGAGEITNPEFYGNGQTFGSVLDASLTVPLPKGAFVRASVARRSLTTDLDGDGQLAQMAAAAETTDTTSSIGLQVGLRR